MGSTRREQVVAFLREHGIARSRDIRALGVPPSTLMRMVENGDVVQLARGLYQLPDTDFDAAHSLAEVARLVPKGVICLISALVYHGLTLQMPSRVWLALPQGTWRPQFAYPPLKTVHMARAAISAGVEHHEIEGVLVPIFSPAKTVADCFKFRSLVGVDVAIEGMRMALRKRKAKPQEILDHASELRVAKIVRPYLEACISDD